MSILEHAIERELIDYIYLTHQSVFTPSKAKTNNYAYIKALLDYDVICDETYKELDSLNDELYNRRENGEIISYQGMTYHSG